MKGYIYKIASPNTDLIYIGSTAKSLQSRYLSHKSYYNRFGTESSKLNSMAYKVFEHGDAYIEKIDEIDYENRDDLYNLEKNHIMEGGDNIVNKSYGVKSKYYNREKQRGYYQAHRPERCQYQREYRRRIKNMILLNKEVMI
jgi:hypothetical protein